MFRANYLLRPFVALALVCCASGLIAQNFVPNPSFETQTGCPTSPGVFSIVGNWYVVPSHGGSPDYHHVCGNTTFGVPSNIFGNQLARTGSAYIGFVTHFGSGNFREYLEVQLTANLTTGTSYTATAYLTLSDGSGWATDGFGFYFSAASVSGTGASTPLPLVPQVSNPTNNFINSWTNWLPVTGNFVATAGMRYMTIGNFKADALTNVQVMPSGWSWNYTYADDFSVTPAVILSAQMGEFSGEVQNDVADLNWDTQSEVGTISYSVERSIGDLNHFEEIGVVSAKGSPEQAAAYSFSDPGFQPSKLNYYRLKEIDQNGAGGYSQTIELHTDGLVNEVSVIAYPNPINAGDVLRLNVKSNMEQALKLEVMDMTGRLVVTQELDVIVGDNVVDMGTEGLNPACYIARVTGQDVLETAKFMVTK
ncbi:MAG: T9SS type A sorting domain-containing protein [Bacteroidia bacterium]